MPKLLLSDNASTIHNTAKIMSETIFSSSVYVKVSKCAELSNTKNEHAWRNSRKVILIFHLYADREDQW